MDQAWVVVTFVQELEDGREGLGILVGERDPLVLGVHRLVLENGPEEGRSAKNVLVGREDPLVGSDDQRHDGRSHISGEESISNHDVAE